MRRTASGFLCLALWGCGDGNLGGGGIEIPNGLDVTITETGTTAPSGAKVRLLARESWTSRVDSGASVVVDSGFTDASGHVHFPMRSTREGWWVEVVSGSQGARLQGDGPAQVSVALQPLSSIEGNLGGGSVAGVQVRLAGSDRVATTDAAGAFRFDSLPQGKWTLVARPHRALAPLATVDLGLAAKSLQGLVPDTSALLLEDFSDGTIAWNLHGLFGNGYWWIASADSVAKVFGTDGAWNLVATDGVSHWLSVPVGFASGRWIGFGLDMGPWNSFLPELSRFSAVRIRCRGTGTWSLAVEEMSDSTVNWTAPLTLDSDWKTVRIPASALSRSGEAWSARARRVRQILFQTTATGKLEIGELWLEGASLSDWKEF